MNNSTRLLITFETGLERHARVADGRAQLCRVARDDGLCLAADARRGDLHALDRRIGRNIVHDLLHDALHNGAQSARADLAVQRLLRDRVERGGLKAELDAVVLQQLRVLLAQSVLRLGQDAHKILFGEAVERGDDRQTAPG